MKLTGPAAARYLARPAPEAPGLLIFGADAMRVALKRQQAIASLVGPDGEAEMRLTRIAAAEARKDPAALGDAARARGFFPGPRVAFLEDATDTLAPAVAAALEGWQAGDAVVVVTAGNLTARSALRLLFEKHPAACAIGIYDDPPGREEIEAMLKAAGIGTVAPAAMEDLTALARALDPGDFRQTAEKIGLYKHGDATPLSPADVAACAPATIEAGVDELLHIVAGGEEPALAPMLRRIDAQGVAPVTLAIQSLRHFRALHAAAADPGGAAAGLSRLRPPVFGPRRDRMAAEARRWGMARLEEALKILLDTDLSLRSSSRAPAMAVMERALIRLCRLAAR